MLKALFVFVCLLSAQADMGGVIQKAEWMSGKFGIGWRCVSRSSALGKPTGIVIWKVDKILR